MAGRCDCSKNCSCAFRPSGSIAFGGSGAAAQPILANVRRRNDPTNVLQVYEATDPVPGVAVYQLIRRVDGSLLAPSAEDGSVILPSALIKDANGAVMTPDIDGAIVLPAASAPLLGDGLTTLAGRVVPNVALVWPQNDLAGSPLVGEVDDFPTFMSPLLRSPEGLFGMPDHTALRGGGGDQLASGLGGGLGVGVTPTGYTSPAGTVWSITNPSKSRRMLVQRSMVGTVTLQSPVGGNTRVDLQAKVGGAATFSTVRSLHWPVPTAGTQAIQFEGELTKVAGSVIAPLASHSVQLRVVATREGTVDSAIIAASAAVELFGVTI